MIVAPNSPSERAQLMTSPAARAGPASGSVTDRRTDHSDAPSARAASSRSRSTPAIPVRAERMKNGAETKVWAMTTAAVVNGMASPVASSGPPRIPRRPRTSSSANPATAGLALLLVLGRRGILGGPLEATGLAIPFTTAAVVIAQTFVSAPFFIRSARTGIAGVDRDLEDAARADGASEWSVLRSVTPPLAGPALAAGLVMSWARSLGEFGATIMFAGNIQGQTQTLPLVVYSEFQGGSLDASIAAAAILVIAAFGVLLAVRVRHWGRALDVRGLA